MNSREKIISLARELRFIPSHVELDEYWMQVVEAFYHKAQAEALEAAAKLCDEQQLEPECPERASYCAAAIREMAKGEIKCY